MENSVANTLEEMFSLEGHRGIITGASSGIGAGIAKTLADAGAEVYDLSRTLRDDPKLQHPRITHIQADVTQAAHMEDIIKKIAEGGNIDFLVNNAGITYKNRAETFPMETWDKIHEINVDAVFRNAQMLYPYLKQSKYIGRIVNISSMAGHLGFSEVVPYCSSKSAVMGITRGLSIEWVKDNILVNSVAPGWFPSKMALQVMDEQRKEKILNRMPLHKFGATKDIGAMVLFLVSNAGNYITGQDFAVDGGALAFGF